MSTPVPPVKTPLGQDELRTRSHGLNQRHRTVLFLVDGRRPLSEVLALALQAGASTRHFEELVHLGLVELAIESAVPDITPSQLGALDSGGASTMSGVLAVDLDPPSALAGEAPRELGPVTLPRDAPMASAPLPRSAAPIAVAASALTIEQRRALAQAADEELLQQVRELLIETLRVDSPLFSAITLMRVHRAHSAKDMINLVWDIERHLGVSRKRRREMLSLHRARELLGMGNTQVSLDADEAGFLDTE